MTLCRGCGAEVVPGSISDAEGLQPFDRLMRLAAGAPRPPAAKDFTPVPHRCRDYLAWHAPADRRDPAILDVAHGWRPARRRAVMAA